VQTDLFLMVDKSGSMNCPAADDNCQNPITPTIEPSRWTAISAGLSEFLKSPANAGVGVGIGFFPYELTMGCMTTPYATPSVPVVPLPSNAMAVSNAVAQQVPMGNTPTVPALSGAITYARTYIMSTPGRAAAVVLVTDGLPNGCNSTVDAATQVAMAGFAGTPPIRTAVVGLGATASLDQLALAGSGGLTHYFPATGNVADAFADALKAISRGESCAYVFPTGQVDPHLINVELTIGGGGTQRIGQVGAASACGPMGGWYYDNALRPTTIALCPQACDAVKLPGGRVTLLLGCPSGH
jgi:hypothetical protein